MATRITKEVLFLKRPFTTDELLQMGNDLALSRIRLEEIEAEEKVMKAQIKERTSGVEQTIGTLSRKVIDKYEMVNVDCTPLWDTPNVGEVSLKRSDTGEIAKIRVMSQIERQMDLPLPGEVVVVPPEESAANIEGFFNPQAIAEAAEVGEADESDEVLNDEEESELAQGTDEPDPDDPFTDPDPEAAKEAVKEEHDEAFGMELSAEKPAKPRRPKGFDKPSNRSAIADF